MRKALDRSAAGAVKPRPASTTLVLRDGGAGPEVLMVRRSMQASFMPGAYVFPGGAVDEADALAVPACNETAAALQHRIGDVTGVGAAGAAFAVAALRECFEECGLWLGLADATRVSLAALRARLHAGAGLSGIARDAGLPLATSALQPWSHWVTPFGLPKRFDTLFFVVAAPPGQAPEVDFGETTALEWVRPQAALAASAEGRFQMEFATLTTVQSLLPWCGGSVAALLAHAAQVQQLPALHPRLQLNAEGAIQDVLLPHEEGYDSGYRSGDCA